jgi:hypothetical protein
MAENGTRVQISRELHELVKEQHQVLRSKGMKGISQEKILEELCKAGLEYQKQKSQYSGTGELQGTGILHPISSPREYIINSKSELKAMEEAILAREQRLLRREWHLDKRETIINDRYEKTFDEKENLLELKKKVYEDTAKGMHEKQKIKDQENSISKLEKDNKELRREIINLLNKIDRKTEKDPFFDYTLPFLAPVMMGFSLFKDNERDKANSKLDPTIQKIIEMYKKGTKEEREKLGKDLLENLNKGLNNGDIGQYFK